MNNQIDIFFKYVNKNLKLLNDIINYKDVKIVLEKAHDSEEVDDANYDTCIKWLDKQVNVKRKNWDLEKLEKEISAEALICTTTFDQKFRLNRDRLDLISFDAIEAKTIDYLGPFPRGMIATGQGDPGSGKTSIVKKIVADLSNGLLPPDDNFKVKKIEPQRVLFVNGEDDPSYLLKPGLVACNADTSKIFMLNRDEPFSFKQVDRLELALQKIQPALMVFDPIQQFLGSDVDMHRANEIRPVMTRIGELAAKYHTACLLIMHMNKQSGPKAQYRGLGSIDFSAIARTQFLIGPNRDNPNEHLFMQIKSNVGSFITPLAFNIGKNGEVHWTGTAPDATEQDILQEARADRKSVV